jgi:putative transposase
MPAIRPGMTAPRQILPGASYLMTRRCTQREFLLRPSRLTNAVVGYLLAVAARRYGILVHAFCVMSNHLHLVVTDPEAMLPAFGQYLDGLIGRAMNAVLGREEDFWGPGPFSAVTLAGPDDLLDKAAYVLANPVTAGLVRRGRKWPGLWSRPEWIGGAGLEFQRPAIFFRKGGKMPERATLALVPPPGFGSAREFREALGAELERREQAVAAERFGRGEDFLGVDQVLAQPTTARPRSVEQLGGLRPRVAARDKWRRIEVLARLADFVSDYRQALAAWRKGATGVIFPAGTYLLRVTHGVACAAAA